MTAPDFAAMTDDELNAEAPRLQQWTETWDGQNAYYKDTSGSLKCFMRDYDPANDMAEAAEFGAAFLAAHPECSLVVHFQKPFMWQAYFYWGEFGSAGVDHCDSEARARTEAICKAWNALGQG